nr:DNA mismatch repair protein MutS [Candidatus Methanoperedens nitroreducens]
MMDKMTPAMRQYYEAKEKHKDALIFFRMGDFYESFGEDAKVIAKELDITLTTRGRDKEGEDMPLAGIPYHAVDSYLPRLIKKGYKVAICEQLEDPKQAKGVVKRGVIRVITPGTAIDSSLVTDQSNNYLMSVSGEGLVFGVSFLDVSTGELITTQFTDNENYDRVMSEAARMRPAECILPPALYENQKLTERLRSPCITLNKYEAEAFENKNSYENLKKHFGVMTLEGMGCEQLPCAISSAGAALMYAKTTQMRDLAHIQSIRTYFESEFMVLDSITLRNLEIVQSVRGESQGSSLLGVLDRTKTPMGGRMLRKMVLAPLISVDIITERLDAVDDIVKKTLLRYDLRSWLSGIRDIERLIGRIVYGNSNARDLLALKLSLVPIPEITKSLKENIIKPGLLSDIIRRFGDFSDIVALLERALMDDPPVSVREGGMIKDGYNEKLDELKKLSLHGKDWIAELQQQERNRTGIKSLKVGYNSVFGYYIEVTKANLPQVPSDYIRKQTTANGERFYTPALKEKEMMILSADEKKMALEFELFTEINSLIAARSKELQATAAALGELDVVATLAEVAVNNRYVRPEVNGSCSILIRDGRHPVVERSLTGFVPNDTHMDCEENQFLLITGPNMAGKSTYMRQTALIVIMAQIGSFVPASYASVGLVDRIFTRVGAFDDLASGQSTFMIEMVELANILNNATPKSLVLLDEIGRGTSTYDGYSIAKAVVEFIHSKDRVGVRSLFATHYHQLTALEGALRRMKNYHIAVKEEGNDLVFLRKIVPGATDRSYGIHVARLAGVPLKVTQRAREILKEVEDGSAIRRGKDSSRYTQLMLFGSEEAKESPVVEELKNLNVDAMTPLEALNALAALKKKANGG